AARSAVNLELDLVTGRRGSRDDLVEDDLRALTGAEAALVVNNNAAAVLLLLSALAQGKEVIVSRGELVEIGGSFRVPDIMRQSGARLVEVGTTNRTRVEDYARAVTADTAALLKVHRSNFVLTGFVEEASIAQLRELASARGLALWHDLGSGSFYRFRQPALQGHPTVGEEVHAGADVVTLSGDKLLGSVQCGIAVGKAEAIRTMAAHPLYRSLRVDKLRLALLEQDLLHYLQVQTLAEAVPSIGLLERTVEDMEPLAQDLLSSLGTAPRGAVRWEVVREHSLAGGGAAPGARLETLCLALTPAVGTAAQVADRLRSHQPPIVGRIHEERVLLDLRTILPQDVQDVAQAIRALVA
ncbi:MAG TPA: L-seryl-tRNA(Sec) selenium transferase, partial [bacterium]|nr:L-seryl-tRNA(Sec) selenium transferase [bacterium]